MSIGRDTVCSGHRRNRLACAFAAGRTSSSRKPTCWHLLVRLGRSAVMRLAYRHGRPSVFAPGAVARFVGIDQNAGSLDQNTADGGLHAAIPKAREGHRAEIGRNARRRGSLQARQGRQDAKRRKAAGGGRALVLSRRGQRGKLRTASPRCWLAESRDPRDRPRNPSLPFDGRGRWRAQAGNGAKRRLEHRRRSSSTEAVLITNLRRRGLPTLRLPAGFASPRRCPERGGRVDRQGVGSRRLWQCPACGVPHHCDAAAAQNLAREAGRVVREDGVAPSFGEPGVWRPDFSRDRSDGVPETEPEADTERMSSAERPTAQPVWTAY